MSSQILELLSNQTRMLEAIRQVRAPVNAQGLNSNIELHDQLLEAIEKRDLNTARHLINTVFIQYSQLMVSVLTV
ncbi:MAG: hypothetical protein IPK17_20295 [Chloroflexi bacterium]|nr:hypothetical protein [Chloroflexota bacterium]